MASSRALRPSLGSLLQTCHRPAPIASPSYLLSNQPSSPTPSSQQPFSISLPLPKRHTYPGASKFRDANRHRGESAVRRTGTRWRLSVSDEPLPRPVPRSEAPRAEVAEDHGLWDFFYDRADVVRPPAEMEGHGRAWTVEELRQKSWDDLQMLWWVCVKERNRISTLKWENEAAELGIGALEAEDRDLEVSKTMKAIKHCLTERYYAWEGARKLAETDPEVDFSGEGPAYTPEEYLMAEEEGQEVVWEDVPKRAQEVDPSTLPDEKQVNQGPRV